MSRCQQFWKPAWIFAKWSLGLGFLGTETRARILFKLSSLGLRFSNKGLGVLASLGFYHSPPLDKTHKNLLPSSNAFLPYHSWPSWILPQLIKDIHISLHLSCPWFLTERDYISKFIDVFTYIHKHPVMPGHKKHINRLCMSPILTPTDFAFFSLL